VGGRAMPGRLWAVHGCGSLLEVSPILVLPRACLHEHAHASNNADINSHTLLWAVEGVFGDKAHSVCMCACLCMGVHVCGCVDVCMCVRV
jgi:hypothetical protein